MENITSLSNDEIEKFRNIFKKYYDKEISKQGVLEHGLK